MITRGKIAALFGAGLFVWLLMRGCFQESNTAWRNAPPPPPRRAPEPPTPTESAPPPESPQEEAPAPPGAYGDNPNIDIAKKYSHSAASAENAEPAAPQAPPPVSP